MILFIIKMIFLTTLWTLGWKIATSDDMVLEKLGQWGQKKVDEGNKIFDGLIVCEWCLPNIHGILFVWPLAFGMGIMPFVWDWKYLLAYPFCVAGSSFISGILWEFYLTMNAKRNYYKSNSYHSEQPFNSEA